MDQPTPKDGASRTGARAGAGDLVAPITVIEAETPAGAPADVPYHQISILRPPRGIWERIRAVFGVRFFDSVTEPRRSDH